MIINKLPVPTWTWLKGNQISLEWEENAPPALLEQKDKTQYITTGEQEYSQATTTLSAKTGETILQILTPKEKLHFTTHITSETSEIVTLVQVFLGGEDSTTISQVYSQCLGTGSVHIIQLMLGRGDLYSHIETELQGESSAFSLDVGYLTQKQTLDMSVLAQHKGQHSQSNINLEGLIGEEGKKVFRGTIDLQHGAKGAVGQEQETVLLLGDNLQNLTIPVLLCGEEDVKGAHGAAIGELDQDTLFYLESRGIDKETAHTMMTHAKLERVVQKIEDKSIADQVRVKIEEVINHD